MRDLSAQDSSGAIEGEILDAGGGMIPGATVSVAHMQNGFSRTLITSSDGLFRFAALPIGQYSLSVKAPSFALFTQQPIEVIVSQTSRLEVRLTLASVTESVVVSSDATPVDTSTNTLGNTVTGREVLDLPLNGRSFSQLGLLQTGVAQIPAGVNKQGGSMRAGQAYSVNGQRPESNNFLIDGGQNVNRVDAGYALKTPVDAIAEFRILTHTAPPEFGGFNGSTTTVVTKSGTNQWHGTVYEFFRNNALDTRNFFSSDVEPLKQNQFGTTAGGPLKRNRLFAFGYYQGFRNRQGITQSASVPTAAERAGDFSGLAAPLRDFTNGGALIPGGRIAVSQFNPIAVNIVNKLYPLGNSSSSVYTTTQVGENQSDQGGGRLDWNRSERDQFFGRYTFTNGYNVNPFSVRGSPLPGFAVRDDITGHAALISNTRTISPNLSNTARISFLRYVFAFDQRLGQATPSQLGLGYNSTSDIGAGTPFFNLSGYSPAGGAITGPRDTAQNTYEVGDAMSWVHDRHSIKFGGEFRRLQVNAIQAITPNAFYVFGSTFPTSDAFANLLLGKPVTFYGSAQESVEGAILRGFPQSYEFGLKGRHALDL